MQESQYLFVYGTLLSDYGDPDSQSFIANHSELVGKAKITAKMFMVDYYPGIIPCENNEKYYVKGELYRLKEANKLFDFLDKYEEYNPFDPENSEYVRKQIIATLNTDNQQFMAWAYFFNQSVEDLEFLPKGDFLNEYHK